jgi:hypothetical protein
MGSNRSVIGERKIKRLAEGLARSSSLQNVALERSTVADFFAVRALPSLGWKISRKIALNKHPLDQEALDI